ncbi:MFS general substrate transporter [Amylostereum chailletii]|nr:MFS general substrate transporter [Amylostereum chailletii]
MPASRNSTITADDTKDLFNTEKGLDQGPAPESDPYEVKLEREDDPQQRPLVQRWISVLTICLGSVLTTCASSAASFTEDSIAAEFHVSKEVTILGISLYVMGLGLGPLIAGPLSEVLGRSIVYRGSFIAFFGLSWAVAFAPHIAVYLVFRFLTGYASSAFLSVAGGSVSDMFSDSKVATPMAVYTISPFLGPELGPLYSGFVNQHLDWRWTYHILTIWSFFQTLGMILFTPETYIPIILKRKAQRLRKKTGDPKYYAPVERSDKSLWQLLKRSCTTPFRGLFFRIVPENLADEGPLCAVLVFYEPMALLLNLWNALILGILYLAFQAFPIIFKEGHHFSVQATGLTFLGILIGMLLGLSSQPYWNRKFREYKEAHGDPPPEYRLIMGQVGGILVTIGLFWLAFTTYRHVHWIAPIIASVPFGTGVYFVFTSSFTYLVVAYRPIAASAMAANSAMRSSFAAGFPLFAGAMYGRLGTVGATALLAGLTAVMAPLPFIFYRVGGQLRAKSRFASA